MVKVSIIIPIYNCAEYLERCVQSVLNQTERDIQLILVNDGSTDGSAALCDQFAALDDRVTVIHQKNAGVSAARNAGLDVARGEYIGFVDADDYIAENTYEIALAAMGDSDIVMWDAVTVWASGKTEPDTIEILPDICTLCKEEILPDRLQLMAGAVWRCLYRAELVKDIRFPVGIKFSEDRVFNLYAMGKIKTLRYIRKELYFRVMQEESAVHRYHEDYFEACLAANEAIQKALAVAWRGEPYRIVYGMQIINGAIATINNYCYKTSPLTIKQRIQKTKNLCNCEELQNAVKENRYGLRGELLRRKAAFTLVVLAKIGNIKNGC